MDGSTLLCLVLVAYLAWRERAHAVERHWLVSRRGGVPAAPLTASRRRGRGERPRVISAEDDAAFAAWKDQQGGEALEDGDVAARSSDEEEAE